MIANVLLDLGSNNSNISEELAETLGMKSVRGPVERTLNVMGGKQVRLSSDLVRFDISPLNPPKQLSRYGVDDKTKFQVEAWTMKTVCGRTSLVNWKIEKNNFEHLRDIRIPNLGKSDQIDLVLGTDVAGLIAAFESRVGASMTDPVAQLTRLGWFVMGPSRKGMKGSGSEMNSLSFRSSEGDQEEGLERLCLLYTSPSPRD